MENFKEKGFAYDPIYKTGAGEWYHYDETWSFAVGPFDNEKQAEEALERYCKELDFGKEINNELSKV